MSEEQTLKELDARLCKLSVDGLQSAPRVGITRPVWEQESERPRYNLHYKWTDIYEKLKQLSTDKPRRAEHDAGSRFKVADKNHTAQRLR